MTAASLNPVRASNLPRNAIALSIALHAAALLLLPGLVREGKRLELPPLLATLRAPAPSQPAAAEPSPAKATEARAQPRQALPRLVQEAERAAPPLPKPDAPVAVAQPAPVQERTAREDSPPVAAALAAAPVRPVSSPSPLENVVLDDYGRALSELLARQQQYPRLAALRGWEGEVRLRLKVARKGSLVAVQVVHSSGHEVLDQHALHLVQGAALPAPPDSLGDREIQVVVPIQYKLQRPT